MGTVRFQLGVMRLGRQRVAGIGGPAASGVRTAGDLWERFALQLGTEVPGRASMAEFVGTEVLQEGMAAEFAGTMADFTPLFLVRVGMEAFRMRSLADFRGTTATREGTMGEVQGTFRVFTRPVATRMPPVAIRYPLPY